MKRVFKNLIILLILQLLISTVLADQVTDRAELGIISHDCNLRWEQMRSPEYERLLSLTDGPQGRLNARSDMALIGVDLSGRPWFYITHNINAASTIGTDLVWPGGGAGYELTGSGTISGELSIWDSGRVLLNHQEFGGRVSQEDDAFIPSNHSTHVSGTMVAGGIEPDAVGMSYQAQLAAYDWYDDDGEMALAAAEDGLKVSNHSYGLVTGWDYDYTEEEWYWFGDLEISSTEDYGFGFYSSDARSWDGIAYNAPYYTIVKSAGNDRGEGPAPGTGHYVWDNDDWELSLDIRDLDGGEDGYDCIPYHATAKNIITVGAVNDLTAGYTDPESVVMSTFSGWGPTDDGRIKPDLVANGIGLFSCVASANDDYDTYSGTSMATPNLSGSLNLLYRHYEATHDDNSPLSATVKALLIHTADEAGPDEGPDYIFGWGLANIRSVADLVTADEADSFRIQQQELILDGEDQYTFYANGTEPVIVTLVWTDPQGPILPESLNPITPVLINDLDMRLVYVDVQTTYQPYVLDGANPSLPATTGDNDLDNVEKIYIADPSAGEYRLEIDHEGALTQHPQAYSIVVSGLTLTEMPPETPPPDWLTSGLDNLTGEVLIDWWPPEEMESQVLSYDDSESDGGYYFNDAAAVNSTMGVRFTAPGPCLLLEASAFVVNNPPIPLNNVSFMVWQPGVNEAAPGEMVYWSESTQPEENQWLVYSVLDANLRFDQDFWISLVWEQPGGPVLGRDQDAPVYLRSYYAGPPYDDWTNISEENGLVDADLMIRATVVLEEGQQQVMYLGTPAQTRLANASVYRTACTSVKSALGENSLNTPVPFISSVPYHGCMVPFPDPTTVFGLANELDELIDYRVYRDGIFLESTAETFYHDNLFEYGEYEYTVTAWYDEGESEAAGPVTVSWEEPDPSPQHFLPVAVSGVPYVIIVDEASIDGFELDPGDEIGIFDGVLCVGAGVIPQDETWPLEIVAWGENPDPWRLGWQEGNEIGFLVWSSLQDFEVAGVPDYSNGDGTFGWGEFSELSLESFTTPLPFDLLEPGDAEEVASPTVTLSWEEAVDPNPVDVVEYDVHVSIDPDDPGDPVAEGLAVTEFDYNGADDTGYWWCIRAFDLYQNETWSSSTRSFSIAVPELPSPFSLVSPGDGETVNTLQPTVVWEASVDPDPGDVVTYTLVWSVDDPEFSEPDSVTGLDQTSYTFDQQLLAGITRVRYPGEVKGATQTDELDDFEDDVTVYWKVRAADTNTDGTWSTPGEGWSFNVFIPENPAPFNLVAPADDIVLDTLYAEFVWTSTADPDPGDLINYVLLLSFDAGFTDPLEYDADDDTVYVVTVLTDDSEYWWKVRADNNFGDPAWSIETWSFSTAMPQPPEQFTLVEPENGAVLTRQQALEVQYVWQTSYDPDPGEDVTYRLIRGYYDQDDVYVETTYDGIQDTTFTLDLISEYGFEYWDQPLEETWRVNALSGEDVVSCIESFDLIIEPYSRIADTGFRGVPVDFSVAAVYPNPFNPTIHLVVGVPEVSEVTVQIVDMLGRQVDELSPGTLAPGYHRIAWTAEGVPSGLYFMQIRSNTGWSAVRKVAFLK